MKPLIKICGIANKDNLIQLTKIEKIDFLGFIFYEHSLRNATIDFVNSISHVDFKNKRPVCVYVNADKEFVEETSSYFVNPIKRDTIIATYNFGGHDIPAIISKDNLIGCQFHPEKSGEKGLELISDFLKLSS